MREILFRGKRTDNGEWVYGWLTFRYPNSFTEHELVPKIEYETEMGFIVNTHVDPNTVGQYTGLDDKNGAQIFEGDLIKAITQDEGEEIFTVVFMNGIFGLKKQHGGYKCPIATYACSAAEVIGNIYDKEAEHENKRV